MNALPIMVFDDVCVLCNASLRFVLRHDAARRFRFATAQSPAGRALYRAHGLDPDAMETVLVVIDGRAYTHLRAVSAVLWRLAMPWPLLTPAGLIPRFIGDRLYHFVASRRYRWFGRRERCLLPEPDLRRRFLEDGWAPA